MRLIRPTTLTDAMLTSSTAPETDYPAWSSATAYAVGARVILTATHRRYEALAASLFSGSANSTAEAKVLSQKASAGVGENARLVAIEGDVSVGAVTSSKVYSAIYSTSYSGLTTGGQHQVAVILQRQRVGTVRGGQRLSLAQLLSCGKRVSHVYPFRPDSRGPVIRRTPVGPAKTTTRAY